MPTIDYFLSTDIVLTKEDISTGLARELTPTLELGNDKRTWNKDQLKALTLILCNLVTKHNQDEGIWIYSRGDRKSTRLNSSHGYISYAVFCLKKKKNTNKKKKNKNNKKKKKKTI